MTTSSSNIIELPVLSCEKCPALCESRKRIVNGRGPLHPRIMIIGEAPGGDEDAKGRPFVGDTGKLLAKLLEQAGIDPTEVYLTNSVRCRPLGNRTPTAAEVANCKPYLLAEIEKVQPTVIVTVGATAISDLMGKQTTLGHVAGQTQVVEGLPPIIPTYHPAYLMRGNWAQSPMVVAHLRKAMDVATGKSTTQTLEEAKRGWHAACTVDGVRELRDYLLSDEVGMIAVDTETTGLSWMEDELLCISFGALTPEGKPTHEGWAVPIAGRVQYSDDEDDYGFELAWDDHEWEAVWAYIKDILGSDTPKTVQNAIFDIKFIERSTEAAVTAKTAFGWYLNNLTFDPMLAQRIVDENLPANETMMLSLYTDMPYYEAEIKEVSKNKRRMDLVPSDILFEYAAADADGLARITAALMPKLQKQKLWWLYENVTIPQVRVAWGMTRRGIPVDMKYFERLCKRYDELATETKAAVVAAAGREFNPQSQKELRTVLFDELKLPKSGRKTEKGKSCPDCRDEDGECDEHDSLGKDALKDIRDMMETPHPIIDATIEFKEVAKRRSMWVDGKDGASGLVKFIRPDAKIHPDFHPGRADTGRWSATKPAIQTPPKNIVDEKLGTKDQIRRIFVAPKGRWWMELDWSQGEVWVMAYESGDKVLMDLLKNGRDVHTFVARKLANFGFSRVFPREIECPELDEYEWKKQFDDYRKKAKVFVFGLDYGMTEVGAAARLGCETEEAAQLIKAFLGDVFPSLEDHFDHVRSQLNDFGILKDRFGRIGHFGDGDFMRGFGRRGQADWEGKFRKGVNMPIQAGLSDLHQLVLDNFETDEIISDRFPMILAVHDSATGLPTGSRDDLVQTAWMIKERAEDMAKHVVLSDGKELGWEIPVEIQWGKSWGDFPYVLMADGNLKEPEVA